MSTKGRARSASTTTGVTTGAATALAAPNVVTIKFENEANGLTDSQLATAVVQLDRAYFDNPPAEVEISAHRRTGAELLPGRGRGLRTLDRALLDQQQRQ